MVELTETTEPLSESAHGLPPVEVVSWLHVSVATGLGYQSERDLTPGRECLSC